MRITKSRPESQEMGARPPLPTPPRSFQTLPLDFDHLSWPPLAPSENSTTPPAEFSADEAPPSDPPSSPRNHGRRSFLAQPANPARVERLPGAGAPQLFRSSTSRPRTSK